MSATECNAQCEKMLSKLNLAPVQKSKLEAAEQDCMKAGCTKRSMEKFMHTAKTILTPEQYTQFEQDSCCKTGKSETKS